jgi:hypothetical protein
MGNGLRSLGIFGSPRSICGLPKSPRSTDWERRGQCTPSVSHMLAISNSTNSDGRRELIINVKKLTVVRYGVSMRCRRSRRQMDRQINRQMCQIDARRSSILLRVSCQFEAVLEVELEIPSTMMLTSGRVLHAVYMDFVLGNLGIMTEFVAVEALNVSRWGLQTCSTLLCYGFCPLKKGTVSVRVSWMLLAMNSSSESLSLSLGPTASTVARSDSKDPWRVVQRQQV